MLFNSYEFLFLFLPLAWFGYFLLHRQLRHTSAALWLLGASLFFYAYWNPVSLPLLLLSIAVNYGSGYLLSNQASRSGRRLILFASIVFNLGLLGYFKYSNFFIENINEIFGTSFGLLSLIFPLGISFFTFTQIAYLVDIYKREVSHGSLRSYVLFVTFFPHLIAGPILHHKEMMPQFSDSEQWRLKYRNIALGLFMLSAGLFKKIVLADSFAVLANAGFDAVHALSFFEAWITSIAYSLQLYFDFSAYSDMAVGIALLFNIQLPLNFNSPYKSRSIREFWQRWHITLGRFLREYVYIPLGGSRGGDLRTMGNLLIVFLLGGFWHGAGWTFIVWGLLNGLGLALGVLWARTNVSLGKVPAQILTLLFVNVTWVFFRASSLEKAVEVLQGMIGMHGFTLPASAASILMIPGVSYAQLFAWTSPGSIVFALLLIALGLCICFFSDNVWELTKKFRPTKFWFAGMAVMFLIALYYMNNVTQFIYFNF